MVEARVNGTTASMEAYIMLRGRPRFLPSACGLTKPILVSPNQARQIAERMIGSRLITKQTGPAGRICNAVSFSVKFEICFFF